MRQIILCIILFFSYLSSFSQDNSNPVKFSQEFQKISDTEYELVMKANIHEGWHMYSQKTDAGGSLPSEFIFKGAGEDYELIGDTEESETIVAYSAVFEVDETFFEDEAIFTQTIRLLKPDIDQVDVIFFIRSAKRYASPQTTSFVLCSMAVRPKPPPCPLMNVVGPWGLP